MNIISISFFSWVITNNQVDLITENTRFQAKEQVGKVIKELKRLPSDSITVNGITATLSRIQVPYMLIQADTLVSASDTKMPLPKDHIRNVLAASTLREDSGMDYFLALDEENEWMHFYIPFREYSVLLPLSMSNIGRRFTDLYQLLGVTILTLTVLHFLFGFAIFRLVITPILNLNEATRKVASGDYNHRVKIDRIDEIGALAEGFNNMTVVIQENFLRIEQMAVTDELTKLYNRRYFFSQLEQWEERSSRYGNFLGLILLDIDFFKRVNDTHGHVAGDKVLRAIAVCLQEWARKSDIVARYGGEEMIILLPETNLEGVKIAAEKIRRAIESLTITVDQGKDLHITASFGVAEFQVYSALREGRKPSLIEFIESADTALYKAKESGRNRVVSADQ